MLERVHMYLKKTCSLSRQGEACTDKVDAGKTQCSPLFDFRKMFFADFAQCQSILDFHTNFHKYFNSLTGPQIPQRWKFFKAKKISSTLRSVRISREYLRTVLEYPANISAQCQNIPRISPRSVRISREYLREKESCSKTILACLSGAEGDKFHREKKRPKYPVTH